MSPAQSSTIGRITSKIQELRQKEEVYQLKYGPPYGGNLVHETYLETKLLDISTEA